MLWKTLAEGLAYVAMTIVGVVMIVLLIRRHPKAANLKASNEIAILCITLLGTLYTVVLAFMLFAVWNRFEVAKASVEHEAVELVACFQLAQGLPTADRKDLQQLLHRYANVAVDKEWKSMTIGEADKDTSSVLGKIWNRLDQLNPKADAGFKDQFLSHFISMTQARNSRILLSQSGLPDVLWILLLLGGAGTICATCLVRVESATMQIFNVAALSTMIVFVLYTTSLIDNPFQGYVSIKPESLDAAIGFMNTIAQQKVDGAWQASKQDN